MNRIIILFSVLMLLAMKPFWDKDAKGVVIQLKGTGHYICSTNNHYVFSKNNTVKCILLTELEQSLTELATGRKKLKVVFADAEQKYIRPDVRIDDQSYTLADLIYYPRNKTLYAELMQGNKYYFFRFKMDNVQIIK